MRLFDNIPIAARFRRAVMMISMVVLLLTCLSLMAYEYYTFRISSVNYVSTLGKVIAANSTAAMAFESQEDAEEVLSALKAEENIVAARLYDREGRIFSQYPENFAHDTMRCKNIEWGYRFVDNHLEGYQRVKLDDRYLGALYIQSNLDAMSDRFRLYSLVIILIIVVAAFLTSFLGRLLQRAISQPVLNLSATAKAIAQKKDYTVRAKRPDDFELGALTDAFNHMLQQVEERDEALSQFNKKLETKVIERTKELEAAIHEQKIAEKEVHQKNVQLSKALEEKQKAERELIDLNIELERRVQDRTNELRISEEQLLIKNAELERTVIDLDNFVYRASHDLKSPISNIEGLTAMFQRQLKGRLDEDEQKLLSMIEMSLAKFRNTISDLTEVSKVQKYQELPDEEVSFGAVLNEVKEDIWQMISESGVDIREDFQVDKIVYASSNLRSIVYNLISNAIKYRNPNRPLVIEIRTFEENGRTMLTVKDNGMGMEPEGLEKIFNMFKRLHAHVDGSGIGLYITKRIIENRGGYIEVSSEIDKGSMFKVVF